MILRGSVVILKPKNLDEINKEKLLLKKILNFFEKKKKIENNDKEKEKYQKIFFNKQFFKGFKLSEGEILHIRENYDFISDGILRYTDEYLKKELRGLKYLEIKDKNLVFDKVKHYFKF